MYIVFSMQVLDTYNVYITVIYNKGFFFNVSRLCFFLLFFFKKQGPRATLPESA
jgi:hypothetical protein